jgi:exodeoxyribonuclease VII large subunit
MKPPERPFDFQDRAESFETPLGKTGKTIYSVSELTSKIKALLEDRFPIVWICGEVSNFRMPASGHCYFTLKDDAAQISAVLFRGQYHRQPRFIPEDGMSVIGLGRLSVYEPRGNYQIILEYVEPAGLGALQLAFEKLKKRLAAEGYFDPQRKKPLPFIPSKISVVTSSTGAVVHDIITVINRRFANLHIEIVPVHVQGPRAESEISAALALVNQRADSDVIILARGGGSLEDLQAFNSETVAMAIFHSDIPVVSAVGHETDVTIADFIADLRAPTPSAAAELVVPEKAELIRRLKSYESSLCRNIFKNIEEVKHRLSHWRQRLLDPRKKIQEIWLRIDDLSGRLGRSLFSTLRHSKERLNWISQRLTGASPHIQVQKNNSKLEFFKDKILNNIIFLLSKKRSNFREHLVKLQSLNPLAILARGYSVTRSIPEKHVITNSCQVSINQELEILLASGVLICGVKGTSAYGKEKL